MLPKIRRLNIQNGLWKLTLKISIRIHTMRWCWAGSSKLTAKKLRHLLRKRRGDKSLQLFQVAQVNAMKSHWNVEARDYLLSIPHRKLKRALLNRALLNYEDVIQENQFPGLPPKRSVDHDIEAERDSEPPQRPLRQLAPEELEEVKRYVQDLLRKGKTLPSKSPNCGSPFFF